MMMRRINKEAHGALFIIYPGSDTDLGLAYN